MRSTRSSLLSSNQERSSRWSFPYKTAQLLGVVLPGDRLDYRTAARVVYGVAFAGVFVWLLWRTWRGADPVRVAGWATLRDPRGVGLARALVRALAAAARGAGARDRRLMAASVALCAWMLVIAVPL